MRHLSIRLTQKDMDALHIVRVFLDKQNPNHAPHRLSVALRFGLNVAANLIEQELLARVSPAQEDGETTPEEGESDV